MSRFARHYPDSYNLKWEKIYDAADRFRDETKNDLSRVCGQDTTQNKPKDEKDQKKTKSS